MFSRILRHRRILLLATPVWLAACATTSHSDLPSGPVDVVEVHRSNQCGTAGAAPQATLFLDVAELQTWQSAHNVDFFGGRLAAVTSGAYALIENGPRNTGGYGVLVSRRANLKDGVLTLTATFLSPPPGQMTTQMITSPCVLVALPPIAVRELVLADPTGMERAHWRATLPASASAPEPIKAAPSIPETPAAVAPVTPAPAVSTPADPTSVTTPLADPAAQMSPPATEPVAPVTTPPAAADTVSQ